MSIFFNDGVGCYAKEYNNLLRGAIPLLDRNFPIHFYRWQNSPGILHVYSMYTYTIPVSVFRKKETKNSTSFQRRHQIMINDGMGGVVCKQGDTIEVEPGHFDQICTPQIAYHYEMFAQ